MKNKNIIITGSAQGLGCYLFHNLKGFPIGIDKQYEFIRCNSTNGDTYYCDITNRGNVRVTINEILNKHEKIDVLINNAGIIKFNDFMQITPDQLDKMYQVNIRGTFLVTKAILPRMLTQNEGHIINILSTRAITGAPTKSAYATTKFGLRGMMTSLREDLKDTNIKVSNICPGKLEPEGKVLYSDVLKSIEYVDSLSKEAYVRDLIIGGQL